jgi:serine/threonine-protein kinase RIO1
MVKKTAHGRSVAAGQWAYAEWDALNRLWKAGVPVPYPVQVDGTELLMEFIDDGEGGAAPRLVQVRPPKSVSTSSSSATGCVSWPGPGWRTATCRRTTSSPRGSGS